ncbi:MAG TPA: hypothetical protein VGP25_03940 [Gemmatimonadaceae bacterium]|jgi:hypothetical protein|nr:hypothetical protein [Gemmatimonadaceae bacterium]
MSNKTKAHTSPDGTTWIVSVESPGSSNAMIVFRHPDGRSSRLDRYNWVITHGPEARSVTSRLDPEKVLEQLDAGTITRLFLRSMPVSRQDPFGGPEPAPAVESRE